VKAPLFALRVARSLDDALSSLATAEGEAKVLAGGQSLVPLMNFRLARPDVVVDINQLTELQSIRFADGELRIGAMTRQRAVETSELVERYSPLLAEALPMVAHAPIRNRGTLGGSLAHADPGAELCTVSLALDARVILRSVRGIREIPIGDLFVGPFTTVLEEDEVLIEVIIPAMPAHAGWAFDEVARRRGDFAAAGVAAMVDLDRSGLISYARLAYAGVGATPLRSFAAEEFLVGRAAGEAVFAEAASVAAAGLSPSADMHATAEYRRHLAEVLTRRTLVTAFARATTDKEQR
jgi:aerobic carbon-monoxide dehydrogenase medium subunit